MKLEEIIMEYGASFPNEWWLKVPDTPYHLILEGSRILLYSNESFCTACPVAIYSNLEPFTLVLLTSTQEYARKIGRYLNETRSK